MVLARDMLKRERFNYLDNAVNKVIDKKRLCVMEILNVFVGDR